MPPIVPGSRAELRARGLPFAVVGALSVASAFVGDLDRRTVASAVGLSVLVIGTLFLAHRRALRTWARRVPYVLAFVVITMLMAAAPDGSSAGFAPLALLPVIWLALYERTADVVIALVLEGASFATIWQLQHSGTTGAGDALRRLAILWAVSAVLAWTARRLLSQIKESHRVALESEATLRDVSQVARALHDTRADDDARSTLCNAAVGRTGARFALLFEASESGEELIRTAAAGLVPATLELGLGREPSGAATAFLHGERVLVDDARHDPVASARLAAETGAVGVLCQPVLRGGMTVAVLVVAWGSPGRTAAARHLAFIELLAEEAAWAIERESLLDRLAAAAMTDSLTGLPNRRHWDAALAEALAGPPPQAPLCVAILDLDRFKEFNDSRGHPHGDALLVEAAAAWSAELRDSDLLARYGGEEFTVLLSGCGPAEGVEVLERLRRSTPDAQTCSIGLAVWDGRETGDHLLRRADAALYRAKSSGRDRLVVAAAESLGGLASPDVPTSLDVLSPTVSPA